MNLRKKILTVSAIALLSSGIVTEAIYAEERTEQSLVNGGHQVIAPMWSNISFISPDISSNGKILYPEVYIEAKSFSGSISGKMYLERYDTGRWLGVTSWSINGTGSVFLSKSYTGVSGVAYRTRVSVNVDGETAEAVSGSCQTTN
jgi:hypothetical protein